MHVIEDGNEFYNIYGFIPFLLNNWWRKEEREDNRVLKSEKALKNLFVFNIYIN
jgi:hypothetical protein